MSRKLLLISGLFLLLTSVSFVIRVERVEASGTVYIRANGLVEGTDKITSADNITYTFTGNVNDSLIIERSNIIVDGEGYTLQGNGSDVGIWSSGITNVTIQELEIRGFAGGVCLDFGSSNNKILGNMITTNDGIGVQISGDSNHNNVTGNIITACTGDGVFISLSSGNTIAENDITGGGYDGIYLEDSSNNVVSGNTVSTNDGDGVSLYVSHNNMLLENIIHGNTGDGVGISLSHGNLVSANDIVENTYDGTYVTDSNNNTISGNTIALNGEDGVGIYSSHNNTLVGNVIAGNADGDGIGFYGSYNNVVSGNNITWNTYDGIYFYSSWDNIVSGNIIADNDVGLELESVSGNKFFHNNLTGNLEQVIADSSNNFWDNGYPSGGNYWDDFSDVDNHSGPYQNQTGSDGIWDHPYVINENNVDHYPVVPEFPALIILPLFIMATSLVAVVLKKSARAAS